MSKELLEKINNGETLTIGETRQILEDPEFKDYECNLEFYKDETHMLANRLSDISDWLSMLDDIQSYLCGIDNSMAELVDVIKSILPLVKEIIANKRKETI